MVTRYDRMLAVKGAKGCAISLATLGRSRPGLGTIAGEPLRRRPGRRRVRESGDDNVLALMRFPNNHRPRLGGTRVAVLTR